MTVHQIVGLTAMVDRKSLIVLLLLGLISCSPGKPAFESAQFCTAPGDVIAVKEMFGTIAQKVGLKFYDRSADTEIELRHLRKDDKDIQSSEPELNFSIRREDGMGAAIGNLGLGPGNILVSFFRGDASLEEARRFSEDTINLLGRKWQVKLLREDEGAKPLACP